MAGGKRDALFKREKNIEAAEFFGVIDGIDAFEMKNRLTAMVLTEPAGFNCDPARLRFPGNSANKHLLQFGKALGKIGEQYCGNFALIAAGAQDAGDNDPAWSFRAQE